MESDHEEADTRLLLHAHHVSTNYPQVIVQSPDTDVAVICVHKYSVMSCQKLWFLTGVKNRRRYIPIHDIVSAIGPDICKVLPALHALTGCDSTSTLRGIGKKTSFRKLLRAKNHHTNISQLANIIPPTENTIHACEQLVYSLYTTSNAACKTLDEDCYWKFCQKRQKTE